MTTDASKTTVRSRKAVLLMMTIIHNVNATNIGQFVKELYAYVLCTKDNTTKDGNLTEDDNSTKADNST
jgi:hypothetical protein